MTTSNILSQLGSPGVSTGFKNKLINGAMNIWQRGTSTTVNGTVTWLADRWSGCQFANETMSQSSSVPTGFQYSLKAQRPASGTSTGLINIAQTVEYQNMYDLAGQTVTFSFWALAGANFSAASSLLGVQIQTGTTADQGTAYPYYSWTGVTQPVNTTTAISTTWTRYTFTAAIPSNAKELIVVLYYTPVGTAGADDAFYATGLQLEVGTTATNFEYLDIARTTIQCQRYCQVLAGGGSARGPSGSLYASGASGGRVWYRHVVTMRASPTLSGISSSAWEIVGRGPTNATYANPLFSTELSTWDGTSLSDAGGSLGAPFVYNGTATLSAEL
jgi:hypothetical protein